MGVVFDDIYSDTDGGSNEFEEIQSGSELKVDGDFEAPGTTAVGESSNSFGASIDSIYNGWAAEGAKISFLIPLFALLINFTNNCKS